MVGIPICSHYATHYLCHMVEGRVIASRVEPSFIQVNALILPKIR